MALETDEFDLDVAGEIEGTDKSSAVSFCWDYLSHYQELFVPWKNEAINLIEVGIQTGRSLKVWEAYFPRATIVGLDIDQNCTRFANNRTVIEIGSRADPGILHRVTAKYPPTIFIDDGSHLATHIIYTFERVFPSLLPGGLYIVEDLALHLEEDGEKWNGGSPTAAPNYFLDLAKLCMARARQLGNAAVPRGEHSHDWLYRRRGCHQEGEGPRFCPRDPLRHRVSPFSRRAGRGVWPDGRISGPAWRPGR
jgi:hypothetical protein